MTRRRAGVASLLDKIAWTCLSLLLGVPPACLAQVQGGLGGGRGLPVAAVQSARSTLNELDSEPPPSDCITQAQRASVQGKIAEYERRSGRFARLSHQGEPQPYPFYPQGGNLWQDLFVTNFVDLDPTSGIRDWDCSDYTYDGHNGHDTDLRSFGEQAIGVPIFAALDGVVVDAHDGEADMNTSWQGQPANYVVLDHGGGHYTYYWHMRNGSVAVGPGQTVPAGTQLGLTGSSGNSTGPHLHFESHYNGTWYEPSAGPCRPGKSYWVAQTPIRRDMYLRDLNVTAVNIAAYPGLPFDMPRTGTFVAGTGSVSFWINLINMPAGSTWRVRFVRPNSTVALDSGTVAFNNSFYRWSWWWWSYLPGLNVTGTWHILLDINGQTQAQAPFEVVSTQSQVTNRPPYAVSTALNPPTPTDADVTFCRVATSLISDDPDYDIVRYRYQWSAGATTIRDVTHAGQADAIPRGSAHAGETIDCTVTPCDGLACGASTTVSAVVAAVPSATETPSQSPPATPTTPGSVTPTPSATQTATLTAAPTITPNQTAGSSPTLAPGVIDLQPDVPASATVENANEVHSYRIAVTGSEPLFVHLDKRNGWDAGVAVYYGTLNAAPLKQSEAWEDQLLMVEAPQPGTYYIRVWSSGFNYPFGDHRGLPGTYTLTVRRSLDAVGLGPDAGLGGTVPHTNDSFWYQVEVTGTEPLIVQLDKPNGWDAGLAIYAGTLNSTPVKQSETWEDQLLMVEAPQPETYYIRVWSSGFNYPFGDHRGLPGTYTLTVRRSLDAVGLGPDAGLGGTVPHTNDSFWYQVEVTGTEPLIVQLDKPNGWDAGLAIYAGTLNSTPVKQSEAWEDQLLMVEAPQPETYYIRVWSSGFNYPFGDHRGLPGTYRLTVRRSFEAVASGQTIENQRISGNQTRQWLQLQIDAGDAGRPLYVRQEKSTAGNTCLLLRYGTLPADKPDSSTCGAASLTVGVSAAQEGTYYIEVVSQTPSTVRYSIIAFIGDNVPDLLLCAPKAVAITSGDLLFYQLSVPPADSFFVTVQKKERAWNGSVALKRGGQVVASATGSGDSLLQVKSPQAGEYTLEINTSEGGEAVVRACSELPMVKVGELVVGTIYRNDGYHWAQMEIPDGLPGIEFVVETVGNISDLDVWRGSFDSAEHWRARQSFNPPVQLSIPNPKPGTYYLRVYDHGVLQGSQVRDYSIVATVRQAEIVIDNETLRVVIDPDRGSVTNLVFKAGSNKELIGGHLMDLGTDAVSGAELAKGWQQDSGDVGASTATFDFSHRGGFGKRLSLRWSATHIEVRTEITSPLNLTLDNNVLPAGGFWDSGDRWAVPMNTGVQTGNSRYPAGDTLAAPSENWMAFWDSAADEVYGFTFTGGYQLQAARDASTPARFWVPAGSSILTFHVVRPKSSPAYAGIQDLTAAPYLTLSKAVDKHFAKAESVLTYTLTYSNSGSGGATRLQIVDSLPDDVGYVIGSASNGAVYDSGARTITWNVGSLDAATTGQSVSFQARINSGVANGATLTNAAQIVSAEDPFPVPASVVTKIAAPEIKSLSTDSGANTGTVTITITGQNFDPNAQVKLTMPGQPDIIATGVSVSPDGTRLTATFDLQGAHPGGSHPGQYGVVATNPDGQTATLTAGFAVTQAGEAKLWAEIAGRGQIRIGRESTFLIQYGNSGTVDARLPLLVVGLPQGVRHQIDVKDAWPPVAPPAEPPAPDAIDLSVLDLPTLPPGESRSLELRLTPQAAKPITVLARITLDALPYFDATVSLRDQIGQALEAAQVLDDCDLGNDNSKYPSGTILYWFDIPDRSLNDGRGNYFGFHMGKSIGCHQFIDILTDGVKIRPLDDNGTYYGGRFEAVRTGYTDGQRVRHDGRALAGEFGGTGGIAYDRDLCPRGIEPGKWKTNCLGLVHLLDPELRRDGLVTESEIWDKFSHGKPWPLQVKHYSSADKDKCINGFRDLEHAVRAVIDVVGPTDPNDKAGPVGFDLEDTPRNQLKRSVAADHPAGYMVFFENDPEGGTAPAQEVLITDQLDPSLDWSTFSLGAMQVGEKTVSVPEGQQNFTTAIDLRPELSSIVEVSCSFDPSTGLAQWLFRGTDPYTGELTDFLPPNTDAVDPRGRGWISYSVKPRPSLPTGALIRNKATIDFEVGVPPPPMDTPEVFNTIDADAPESRVLELAATQSSTSFDVRWSGADVGSGVQDYTIFVSENGGPYTEWLRDTTDTSAVFTGQSGKQYAFYSVARDHVGNIEAAPAASDVVTTVAGTLCVGDCDGGGSVTVNEIITMVNVALGNAQPSVCIAGDVDSNGEITINEIITAVNNALSGCPP